MSPVVLEKVRRLEKYIEMGFGPEIWIDNVLSKLIDSERERLMATERKLCEQLREFERTYSMDSEPFYERFERGQLADEMDYFDWAATVEMVKNLRDRLPL
ncbi:MAG: hypothetical protein DRP97_00270 [Candidatus Latescibacterota bacterium]|nr:MAG: hypothetical protein DRP97_00270 [Candidatus Latescibacterota bacterium]